MCLRSSSKRVFTRRKPSIGRFLFVALVASGPTMAATWTLERATAHALASSGLDDVADARMARERAAGRAALPWENPFVGYQREQSFGVNLEGTAEDYLWLGQTFDLSLRRGLYEDAGERRAEAARLDVEEQRRARARDVATLFALVLALDARVESENAFLARIDALADTIRARESAGDASQYDVLRVMRERASAARAVDEIHIAQEKARASLAHLLGDSIETLVVEGELAPPRPLEAASVPRPPEARALDEEARALAIEHEAASRWFVPPVTVTGGGKTVFAPGATERGYLVTAQVPLPVFDRRQHERDALVAEERARMAEAEITMRDTERAALAARAEWARALLALEAHHARTREASTSLVSLSRAAYAGGELSLLALLEAERTLLDDERASNDLALRARLAQIEHDLLTLEIN